MIRNIRPLPLTFAVSAALLTSTAFAAEKPLLIENTEEAPYAEDILIGKDSEYAGLKNTGFISNGSIVMGKYGTFDNDGGTIRTGV